MLARGEGNSSFSIRRAMRPLFFVAVMFYLSFQAFSGERGIFAYFKETRRLEVLKTELAAVTEKRSDLEHRVRLLSASSLDLDLLDEQSRTVLGAAGKGEVVIFTDK